VFYSTDRPALRSDAEKGTTLSDTTISRSSRDPQSLAARLEPWLRRVVDDPAATVDAVDIPESNGMSSETLLLEATWTDEGAAAPTPHRLVARVAPAGEDVPVFPDYDLSRQFDAMRLVGERTDVPVPAVRWLEEDPDVLGAPFLVMDRLDGRVPPDVLPYTFEGWLLDASPADQRHLQDATVRCLAGIHQTPLSGAERDRFAFPPPPVRPGAEPQADTPLRRHVEDLRTYYDWVRGDDSVPVLDRGFAWLEEHWPADEGDAVLIWGDARIGNVMYDGFDPLGVLDWEMAGLAPRGVDLGWMSFLHTFFQDITEIMELPGLPGYLDADDLADVYEQACGVRVTDLDFYRTYAALRHGVVMSRVHARRVHFGEVEQPADPDDMVMHRARLEQLLGTRADG